MAVASAVPYVSLHLAPADNHVSTPTLSFLQSVCPSCRPTNSIKALRTRLYIYIYIYTFICCVQRKLRVSCLSTQCLYQLDTVDVNGVIDSDCSCVTVCVQLVSRQHVRWLWCGSMALECCSGTCAAVHSCQDDCRANNVCCREAVKLPELNRGSLSVWRGIGS